jgi:hypothetical protein
MQLDIVKNNGVLKIAREIFAKCVYCIESHIYSLAIITRII